MSTWAVKRRLYYFGAVFVFFALIFTALYFVFIRVPASCTDGLKNQNEIDADCGGACRRVCEVEVSPLIKTWTRLFKTVDGKYDAAALIENPNFGLGIKELSYTFKFYDAKNLFVTEKSGKVFVNARDKFIIFESGLDTGKRIPMKATIEFKPMIWSRVDPKKSKLPIVVQGQHLIEGQTPRLAAEIINNSILDLTDMVITAVVYDEDNNAIAVSQTFINYLKKGVTDKISFTWPEPFAVTRPTIEIYPRVNLVNEI
ncbi:MAG: hypothetical protein Q7S19_03545 [bacterium]|nr:hypothetical protein [bacterium]